DLLREPRVGVDVARRLALQRGESRRRRETFARGSLGERARGQGEDEQNAVHGKRPTHEAAPVEGEEGFMGRERYETTPAAATGPALATLLRRRVMSRRLTGEQGNTHPGTDNRCVGTHPAPLRPRSGQRGALCRRECTPCKRRSCSTVSTSV